MLINSICCTFQLCLLSQGWMASSKCREMLIILYLVVVVVIDAEEHNPQVAMTAEC